MNQGMNEQLKTEKTKGTGGVMGFTFYWYYCPSCTCKFDSSFPELILFKPCAIMCWEPQEVHISQVPDRDKLVKE